MLISGTAWQEWSVKLVGPRHACERARHELGHAIPPDRDRPNLCDTPSHAALMCPAASRVWSEAERIRRNAVFARITWVEVVEKCIAEVAVAPRKVARSSCTRISEEGAGIIPPPTAFSAQQRGWGLGDRAHNLKSSDGLRSRSREQPASSTRLGAEVT